VKEGKEKREEEKEGGKRSRWLGKKKKEKRKGIAGKSTEQGQK
jgi:hypothetical protein